MFTVDVKQQYNNNTRKYDGKVSIASRNITNLWFADDTNALAEEEQKLEVLAESLDKNCTRYIMEVSKLLTNSANGIQRQIEAWNRERLQVSWSNCFRCSLKDCTSHCSSDKAEANLER